MTRKNHAEIGTRIRSVCASRGMTQETLAERAELSAPYICDVERARKTASIGALERIAHALGVSLGWLIDGARDCAHRSNLTGC